MRNEREDPSVRVRQYVHFSITSQHVTASEITARLGIEPDEVTVRGSRLTDPATPPTHAWTITCTQPGLSVDQQLLRIVSRLRPCFDDVIALSGELAAADPEYGGVSLELVSYPDAHPAAGETAAGVGVLDPLRQWALERDAIQFLLATNAALGLAT